MISPDPPLLLDVKRLQEMCNVLTNPRGGKNPFRNADEEQEFNHAIHNLKYLDSYLKDNKTGKELAEKLTALKDGKGNPVYGKKKLSQMLNYVGKTFNTSVEKEALHFSKTHEGCVGMEYLLNPTARTQLRQFITNLRMRNAETKHAQENHYEDAILEPQYHKDMAALLNNAEELDKALSDSEPLNRHGKMDRMDDIAEKVRKFDIRLRYCMSDYPDEQKHFKTFNEQYREMKYKAVADRRSGDPSWSNYYEFHRRGFSMGQESRVFGGIDWTAAETVSAAVLSLLTLSYPGSTITGSKQGETVSG